jgi:hypothetical protein
MAHATQPLTVLKNLWEPLRGANRFLNFLFLFPPFINVCEQQMSGQFFLCVISFEVNGQIFGREEQVADVAERVSFMLC